MKFLHKFALVAVFAIVDPFAIAHVWFVDKGVHFKGLKIDFGPPPARYALYAGNSMSDWPAWRPGTTYMSDEPGYDDDNYWARAATHRRAIRNAVYAKAERLEWAGLYRGALAVWEGCLARQVGEPGTSRKRIDLLRILVSHPNLTLGRRLLLATQPIDPKVPLPNPMHLGRQLRPFALYEQINAALASLASAKRYLELANDYPESPMAEPALIMVPRILLDEGAGDLSPANFRTAQLALDDLARRYPHSRFRADVIGLRGRIYYLGHHYREALRQYRRQFELSPRETGVRHPLESIILCAKELRDKPQHAAAYLLRYGLTGDDSLRFEAIYQFGPICDEFTAADAKKFWGLLRADPRLANFYLDYRLDNTRATPDLLALSTSCKRAVVRTPYAGHFLARLAEAAYQLRRDDLAKKYGREALRVQRRQDDSARASFVLASVAKRQGRTPEAIRRYEEVLKDYPSSYLCNGAKENLALLYEREGRLGDALDVYQSLGYKYDVAYMLDIRMTPDQIRSYIVGHPRAENGPLLRFSLGMRYLRKHEWLGAERVLSRLSKQQRAAMTKFSDEDDIETGSEQDPLKTARDLAHLDRALHKARSSGGRAEALLATANYYYDHRNLLLYNPRLWEGLRAYAIGFSWNWNVASPQDDRALKAHHWEHECVAQSLLLCRRIVKQFPRSNTRFRAAYQGACAAQRLSTFSPYWRWIDNAQDFSQEAVDLMKVAEKSPNVDLASRAEKYAGAFTDEESDDRQAFPSKSHSSRWHSQDDSNSG